MKKFALVLAGVLLGAPLALSAEASAAAEQIGRPASELVEMELLTSSEVVEKQKAGFINVIIANGGTEARGPQNILAGHTIMSQRTAIDAAKLLGNTLVAPVMPIDIGATGVSDGSNIPGGITVPAEIFKGLKLAEIRDVAAEILRDQKIDFLDMSLWDVAKEPNEDEHKGRTLMSVFTDLPRGQVRLGAAGKVMTGKDAAGVLDAGCDYVVVGRGAILRHDFPKRVQADANYISPPTTVTIQHLLDEGLSPAFVQYMRQWPNFVEAEATAA